MIRYGTIVRIAAMSTAVVIGLIYADFGASFPEAGLAPAHAAGAPSARSQAARGVGALGRIEPRSELIEIGGPAEEQLAQLSVQEGDEVSEGQPLGYLRTFAEHAAERERIAALLDEAEQMLQAVTAVGEAAVQEAEVRIRSVAESYPLRIRAQEARIRQLEAELANNIDILKSRQELLARQTQARRDVDNQQSLVVQNQENLKGQRDELERLKKEMQVETISTQVGLQRARAELLRSRAAIGVDSLRRHLAVAEARAAASTLIAPIDGRILKIATRPGERLGAKPILTMGDTREMHAVAEVYETDIGRVRLGQRATVTSPALSKALSGTVVKIGQMIFKNDVLGIDPSAKVDARVVEVRILLDESALVAGLSKLSVDVVIQPDDPKAAPGNR